jgi:hypothetical protein
MTRDEVKNLEQNGKTTAKNKIELRSVWKNGKTTVTPVPDGMGWYLGIPKLSEEQKRKLAFWAEPTHTQVIKHGTTFDLNDAQQKATWDWVKFSPTIAPDERSCQFTPGAEFYVHEEFKEFAKSITQKELRLKAGNLVMNDPVANHALRALLLGVDMDGFAPAAIKDYLLEVAEHSPEQVIEVYESKDLSNRLLFLKALNKNIITTDQSGIYYYGKTVLGVSEKSAVAWIGNSENKNIVEMLEKEVNPQYFKASKDKDDGEEKKTTGKSKTK